MLIALYLTFVWVPTEATMGIVQRIFYFHVPSGAGSISGHVAVVSSVRCLELDVDVKQGACARYYDQV